MEELISRIAEQVGIDEGIATKAVEIILGFLNKEGDNDLVAQVMEAIPGASEMVANAGESSGGGLMGAIGGMMGGSTGGLMAAASELMSSGLEMGQIQGVTQEIVGFAKEKAGDEVVDQLLANIPGLDQFA